MTTEARDTGRADSPHLRRELHLWEAVGISLALMAPSMAANINPQGTADTGVGRAVPLAFALATIGVLLIAWTFVRLTTLAACTASSGRRWARGPASFRGGR
jgi:amino acid transporter